MRRFRIKVAGQVGEIETKYARPLAICSDFFTDEPPDFFIKTTQEEIEKERLLMEAQFQFDNLWDNTVEASLVHRKIAEALIDLGVFLMHGAVISVNNSAYIFSGRSGIGKSTHIQKWENNCPGTIVINGDKPFIIAGEKPMACGSPWAGKENKYANTIVPLKSVVFLERSDENHIYPISFSDAFPSLLQQTYRPHDNDKVRKTILLLRSLEGRVRFYRFMLNNFKEDVFSVAYKALVLDNKDNEQNT